MTAKFHDLLASLRPTTSGENGYAVLPIPECDSYYVGRDSSGFPALLIKAGDPARHVPIRVAGLEARFAVPCTVKEPDASRRSEILTVIVCTVVDRAIEKYFASISEVLVGLLGNRPRSTIVAEAVNELVRLFQRLRTPARKSLVGLLGELCVILRARDTTAAIRAWRVDPLERYDFALGNLRLEAKATVSRTRIHTLSLEQAEPPADLVGLLTSVLVEPSGGGSTIRDVLDRIERQLPAHADVVRLWSTVADTMGETLPSALEARFDIEAALASARLYDLRAIPAIRPPLPQRVSGVRFMSDLSDMPELVPCELSSKLAASELALLPK